MEEHALRAMFNHVNGLNILPVSKPNIADVFEDSHIRLSLLPVPSESLSACSNRSKYGWILQASVYVRDGIGAIKPLKFAQQLKDTTPKGFVFTSGGFNYHTEKQGDLSPAVQSDGWYTIHVSFRVALFK